MFAKLCFMLIILQCFILLTLLEFNSENTTLKLVHVLFRHGDRSPTETYPNDPHKDHEWPGGLGQLTKRGKIEEFTLGLYLRERYKNFLPEQYDQKYTLVESSYADRCIMSAQLLLAGLYPPKNEQIWNENLLWQPVPVHSVPRNMDNKIVVKKSCPKYEEALANVYKSEKITNIDAKNKELYEYLSKHTGSEINNILTLELLYNTLEIEEINNLSLPNWTNSVYPDKMKEIAALSLAVFSETEYMKKMFGGMLMKDMLTHMNDKRNNNLTPNRLMFLYSGHDLTIVTFLRVLGFPELLKPDFAASVILELHEINGEFIVKFFYQKNPYDKPEEIILEKCGGFCKLEILNEKLKAVIPNNWEDECIL